jgi:hypothetical protein
MYGKPKNHSMGLHQARPPAKAPKGKQPPAQYQNSQGNSPMKMAKRKG